MEEWKEYRLGDLIELNNGFAFKSKDFIQNGIPVIKIKNVKPNRILLEDLSFVSVETAQHKKCVKILPTDILITMTGNRKDGGSDSWVGKVALFKKEGKYLLNQRVSAIKVKRHDIINYKYLAYLLSSWESQLYFINNSNSSGGQANISPEIVNNYIIYIPSLYIQNSISNILSSLDDKIELNRRINENLEQQAQALFKSWFVDFEPFKDGKFVDSELGMIPEGWNVKKLGELCDSISVTHPCKEGQLIFLNTGDIENGFVLNHKYMNIKDMPGQAKKSIQENDILYSEIRPINRHFAFVNFPAQEYIVSTKLMVLRANDNESSIRLYQYLTSEDVINELQHEAESRSGTFPQIRFENIKSLKILIGSDDVEKKYTKYIGNIYKMIFQYRKEIMRLAQLRDTLLPRLMSGELAITDVDDRSIFQ